MPEVIEPRRPDPDDECDRDQQEAASSEYECETCGSLWTRHALSIEWPSCCSCGSQICSGCPRLRCAGCKQKAHDDPFCVRRVGDEFYCHECWKQRMREALKDEPLEDQLEASLEWPTARRRKAS